jgi:hypothetical protein
VRARMLLMFQVASFTARTITRKVGA